MTRKERMIELKEEEDDTQPSMNQNMMRFMHFCCENKLVIKFQDTMKIVVLSEDSTQPLMNLEFSDFYFPKNLLKILKEKL